MFYTLFRYLHFVAILIMAGAVVIEAMAVKPTINGEDARNIAKVDGFYGLGAMLTLLFGLTLWLWVGKPGEFYSLNPLFLTKFGLFFLLAGLSIYPTVFFIRSRNAVTDDAQTIEVPGLVRLLIKAELLVLAVMPVLAFLMARGIGLPG